VVDAAGAIYVIGGTNGTDYHTGFNTFSDVWVSTDGGARPDSVQEEWGTGGVLGGYSKGYYGVLMGTNGVLTGY
jgi:hypothetical protein